MLLTRLFAFDPLTVVPLPSFFSLVKITGCSRPPLGATQPASWSVSLTKRDYYWNISFPIPPIVLYCKAKAKDSEIIGVRDNRVYM